ncbi:MAG: phosphatidate cytidylyltransferase [Actinomycetota bacterium]|nr:phosphatidate cytidylyltransferase [Actinomycetota bacterium]
MTQSPTRSRAGRDLGAAIAVGVVLAAVVLATLALYRPGFVIVVGVAVLISLWELVRALESRDVRPPTVPLLVGAISMLALTYLRGSEGLVVAFILTVLACIVWRLADGARNYLRDVSTTVFVVMYVPLLAGFAVLLVIPQDGAARVIAFITTVVCSDVGGYAAGVFLGRHPMAASVSPKKTWEGFAGSAVLSALAGALFLTLALGGVWWQGVLYGLAIAAAATLGDLGESMIKRDLGLKDMGSLLPGHGGLMDRMDSLLPTAAVAWLLLSVFVPPA